MSGITKVKGLLQEYEDINLNLEMLGNEISFAKHYGQIVRVAASLLLQEHVSLDELQDFIDKSRKALGDDNIYVTISHEQIPKPYKGYETTEYTLKCLVDEKMSEKEHENHIKRLIQKRTELLSRKYEIEQIMENVGGGK